MQDHSTTALLGELDREMVEHRVRTILERRAAGDAAGVMDYLAPEIVFRPRGAWKVPAFGEGRTGKASVAEMLVAINARFENRGSVIHEIAVDGERVAVHRTATLHDRQTGLTADVGICNFLRFRDGLVVEFSEYPDTATVARFYRPQR